MTRRLSLALVCGLGLIGCGARTGLDGGPELTGTGGDGGGGGAVGGGGGEPTNAPCELVGVRHLADESDLERDSMPALSSSLGGTHATVAFRRLGTEWSVRQSAFLPWGSWPADTALPASIRVSPPAFSADTPVALVGTPAGYSALFSTEDDVGYVHDSTPELELPPATLVDQADMRPLFLTDSVDDRRLGAIADFDDSGWARFVLGSDGGLVIGPPFACASGPTYADAVASDDGWLVVTGNDDSDDDCDLVLDEGPPRNLQLLEVTHEAAEMTATLVHEQTTTDDVTRVAIARASGGVWVAWQTDDHVWVSRLNASGEVLVPPFVLDAPIGPPSAWDLATSDDGFIYTQVRTDPGQPLSTLIVTIVDGTGTPRAQQSFDLEMTVGPSVSILLDEPTHALLVATTQIGDGFDADSHVVVARLSCGLDR